MAAPAPFAPPRDITIPVPGSTAARDTLSRALGRLPRDLRALPPRAAKDAAGRADLEAFQATLGGVLGVPRHAAALMSALRSPTCGPLLRSLRNELLKASYDAAYVDGVLVDLLATLGFELALAGALDQPLRLTKLPPRILSIAASASLAIPEGTRAAIFSTDGVVFERSGGAIALDPASIARGDEAPGVQLGRPFHAIEGSAAVFATDDNNPRAAFGAEPGEPGNPIDLGGRDPWAWTGMLHDSIAIIAESWPELHAELDLYMRAYFPAGYHEVTHRSASYRESIGAIYLTLHPRVMTMAEALVHEYSHNKLHALFELDPVIENPPTARYKSPVRTDPRPLRGVLLALHAYVPLAYLYERMAKNEHVLAKSPYFHERAAQIRRLNREAATVVFDNARPTVIGRVVLDELRRWMTHFGDD